MPAFLLWLALVNLFSVFALLSGLTLTLASAWSTPVELDLVPIEPAISRATQQQTQTADSVPVLRELLP